MESSWQRDTAFPSPDAGEPREASAGREFSRRCPARGRRRERFVGSSPAARSLEATIQLAAAAVGSTTLIVGETGCGKEEVARCVHATSCRAGGPFVAINCGAMAASLVESQLFGHEKGAFTGAIGNSQGMFRVADGGTVFLDEIGEMPLELQPRLLRALQEREVTPVGGSRTVPFDVRVIAATNRDLHADVATGRFREDLLYRLNTIEIEVPPLRRRRDDLPAFIEYFSRHFAERFKAAQWRPDRDTLDRFLRYHWPGNVRQLAQTVERFYALGTIGSLPDEDFYEPEPADSGSLTADRQSPLPILNLEALRRLAVKQAMAITGGHKGQAAGLLGVHLNTMTRLVEEAMPAASQRRGLRRAMPTRPR